MALRAFGRGSVVLGCHTYQRTDRVWLGRRGRGRWVEWRVMDAVAVDFADIKVFFHFGNMCGLDAI